MTDKINALYVELRRCNVSDILTIQTFTSQAGIATGFHEQTPE